MPKPLNELGLQGDSLECFSIHGWPSKTRENRPARASRSPQTRTQQGRRQRGRRGRLRPWLQLQDVGSCKGLAETRHWVPRVTLKNASSRDNPRKQQLAAEKGRLRSTIRPRFRPLTGGGNHANVPRPWLACMHRNRGPRTQTPQRQLQARPCDPWTLPILTAHGRCSISLRPACLVLRCPP